MIKGQKIRFDIHNILFSIYKLNKNLNDISIKKIINKNKKEDIAFLNNVILNTMRYNLHSLKIIKKYIKKKLRDHEKILLISAITQIVFLDFKEYAVINCSVEIAKKLKIYPGLINATLKNISVDKKILKHTLIYFEDLPFWFRKVANSLTNEEKKGFVRNYSKEPSIHLVFKNKEKLEMFEEKLIKTSDNSGFLKIRKDIKKFKSYQKGDWWVQDFSSFFPLSNISLKDKNKKYLDACSAPGGKAFQVLSKNIEITLNDKSKYRIDILKSNLFRLKFNTRILNQDFTKFEKNKKYDFIILDSPCSAIGTIRRNPEILFNLKPPNFRELNSLQEKMLETASSLLTSNGLILYMVCSFLKNETIEQINKFINKNREFQICDFQVNKNHSNYSKLIRDKFMITLPDTILGKNIDGYFAALLQNRK